MFKGAGKIGVRASATSPMMYAPRANSFSLQLESTEEEANAFPFGDADIRQVVDKIVTKQTYKVMIGIESFDSQDVAFMMGEQIATTNTTFPEIKNTSVPLVSAYTVANADLIEDQAIAVTTLDSLFSTRMLTQIPSAGTLAAGQFKVGAGLITFHSGLAGQAINYMYDKAFTGMKTLGVTTSPTYWTDVSFSGLITGERFTSPLRIFVPSMKATPKFDFKIGDKTTMDIEFTAKVKAGYRRPILIGDL